MRYYKLLLIGIISIALFACEGKQKTFSSDLLIGKWKRPSVSETGETGYDCYRYDANGSGVTWDTADDVNENEAQAFTWKLDKDRLTVIHKGKMGQPIPKVYTVKTLNSTTLSYEDDYGATFTFSKFAGKQKTFSSDLLIGKWKRPSVSKKGETGYDCYRYDANGSGATWDTADDVDENEAQAFTWTLDKDRLTIVYKGEMGQVIPKVYTVKTLNSTTLSYEDDYGATFTFSKFTGKP